jgi:tetratricopeptide (TPR) repeat protein
MSEEPLSKQQREELEQLARAVIGQLAAGRSAQELVRDLNVAGWAREDAEQFVEQMQEQWREIEQSPDAQAAFYLQARFPDMRPADRLPSLFTFNGIGTMMYGARDWDEETGTCVQTQCFCVLFLPILALAAYRVSRADDGGRYVFGRVPLSGLAKMYNVLVVLSLLFVTVYGGWNIYTESEEYQVGRKMARADQAAEAGNLVEASRLYAEVTRSTTSHGAQARKKLSQLVDSPQLDELPLDAAIEVFEQVVWALGASGTPPSVLERGLSLVRRHAATAPRQAVDLLALLALVSPQEAGNVFLELVDAPLRDLSPEDAAAMFEVAAKMKVDNGLRRSIARYGLQQSRRLADSDLVSAARLLTVAAPLGDAADIDAHLKWLLSDPLAKADCVVAGQVIEAARKVEGADGESALIERSITYLANHPDADPRDALTLVDQLAGWDSADADRLTTLRRAQLERLVAAEPSDMEAAVQLALLCEASGELERIETLLTPHRGQLGQGEGARLLGQALAAKGDFEEAHALLGPYLDERLEAFHAAEQTFAEAINRARERLLNQLSQGWEPTFDYQRYESVGDDEKARMIAKYLDPRIRDDRDVIKAREQLAQHAGVVPAALDLGMVSLQRARGMQDPTARQAELERAEKTFLAVRGVAGDSDQYRLNLAQVYYWLGKQDAGRQLFDELLSDHERGCLMLFSVASVLRDLGAAADCRELLEEAYDKASDDVEKQHVAQLRSITHVDLADQIKWLERCDTNHPEVRALLACSRGHEAAFRGENDVAATHYREAIDIYDEQTETTGSYNNGALACFSLFQVSGEREAFDRGVQWLEQAVALSPSDPLVLKNAGQALMKAALQDLAGAELNLRELQQQEEFGALYHLAVDEAALTALRQRAAAHTVLSRARSYFDQAIVLSPKGPSPYLALARILSFVHDEAAMELLLQQIREAKPDAREIHAQAIRYYRFEEDESYRVSQAAELARREALVEQYRGGAKRPMFAAAVEALINVSQQTADTSSFDVDRLVQLADEAHRTAPTRGSCWPLVQALMMRTHRSLTEEHAEYADATAGTGRSLPPMFSVVLALSRGGALAESACSHPDVQRATAIVLELMAAFPDTRSGWSWALLRHVRPERADGLAEALTQDHFGQLHREVTLELYPMVATTACEEYWVRLAAGDAEHALTPLTQAVERGAPLPLEWIEGGGP